MLARFHQALRGTGLTERKYSIDNRFYLFAGQWPDFFFYNAGQSGFFRNGPCAQGRTRQDQVFEHDGQHINLGARAFKMGNIDDTPAACGGSSPLL